MNTSFSQARSTAQSPAIPTDRHAETDPRTTTSQPPRPERCRIYERPMTVAEVAEFFSCNPETIKRRARSGELPGFKLGKTWYFRRGDIDRFMERAVKSDHAIGAATAEEQ